MAAFATPFLPLKYHHRHCHKRLRHCSHQWKPVISEGYARPHRLVAIFLPPEGPPVIPDDESDEEEIRLKGKKSNGRENWNAGTTLETVAGDVREGLDVYDTWDKANKRKSVAIMRGRSQMMLGADELNESLGPKGTDRLRLVLAPDEAFGVIFNWNTIICNARELELECWKLIAKEEGLLMPDLDDVIRAEGMASEAAVQRVFYWGGDWKDVKRWCFRKYEVMKQLEPTFHYQLCDGIQSWVSNLEKYGINYVVCSPLPKYQIEKILCDLKLNDSCNKLLLVSNEDEFDTLEQMYLLAAMKVGRPPEKCVIFADRPTEITAGHETSAKVVGLIGTHPAYEMKTADLSVQGYNDLVVYNVRRLFSEVGQEFMAPATELEEK